MYVYIIGCSNVDYIKIGISTDPKRRISELQTNSPHKLYLAFLLRCANKNVARQFETLMHALLHISHSNGEWFHATPGTAVTYAKMLLAISGKVDQAEIDISGQIHIPGDHLKSDNVAKWLAENPDEHTHGSRLIAKHYFAATGRKISHTTICRLLRANG